MGKPKNTSGTSRAILGLLLIVLIIIGDIISGAVGIASPLVIVPTYQKGVVQCQTVQAPGGMETPGCLSSITFPTAFASKPTAWGISVGCISNTLQTLTSQNITSICAGLGAQTQHPFDLVSETVIPIIPGNFTWKNYPVTLKTACIIQPGSGNPNSNCDAGFQFTPTRTGPGTVLSLQFNCISGGFTGNEWMALQYSLTGGATWINTGVNDTDVGSLCSLFPAFFSFSSTVIIAAITQAQILLRVVGGGGTGLANDNIIFFNIQTTIQQYIAVYPHPSIGSPEGNNVGGQIITKTSMVFYVEETDFVAFVPIMSWWACIC